MPALIFDCDGVLADTERFGHLPAFNQMFAEFGVPVQWSDDEYADLLRIGGGKERMASILTPEFVERTGLPTDPAEQADLVATLAPAQDRDLHRDASTAGAMPPRPGVRRLVGARPPTPAGSSPSPRPPPSHRCGRSSIHAVGDELAAQLRRLRRRRRAAQEARPGHLPARGGRAGRRAGPGHRRRGQPQRLARGARRRTHLPGHDQQLHRRTRTSPAPRSWSRAWASPRRRPTARSGRGPLADPYDVRPVSASSTSRTLEALLQRAPRPDQQQGPRP